MNEYYDRSELGSFGANVQFTSISELELELELEQNFSSLQFQNSSSRTGGVTASIVYWYSEFPELEFSNCGVTKPLLDTM